MIRVLCVDDNALVGEAISLKLDLAGGFLWVGQLLSADNLTREAAERGAEIVLLDIDMPGRNPFTALEELRQALPDVRVLMFTGHVRPDLIERSLDAGAWGYISKGEGADAMIRAIRMVAEGEFYLGPEAEVSLKHA